MATWWWARLGRAGGAGPVPLHRRRSDFRSLLRAGGVVVGTSFEERHREQVVGSLSMFDRLIFKGYLSRLFRPGSLRAWLWSQGVPITGFGAFVKQATEAVVANAERVAADAGRPNIYVFGPATGGGPSKDEMARRIAERDGITEGLVCVLRAVEPCTTFELRGHRSGEVQAVPTSGRCLHVYFYLIDPEFGFMHVRVQTWIPYTVQVYVNGREWLAHQLDAAGVGYLRHDNALLRIDDLDKAFELCDRFAHRAWPRLLNVFARRANPRLHALEQANFGGYYWVSGIRWSVAEEVDVHRARGGRADGGELAANLVGVEQRAGQRAESTSLTDRSRQRAAMSTRHRRLDDGHLDA
jgi:hypothetical protein